MPLNEYDVTKIADAYRANLRRNACYMSFYRSLCFALAVALIITSCGWRCSTVKLYRATHLTNPLISLSGIAFAGEPEHNGISIEEKVEQCRAYILKAENSVSPERALEAATIIVNASAKAKLTPGWAILAALARRESTFNPYAVMSSRWRDARGWHPPTYCRGLLQVHPCWRSKMKRAGLDFYKPEDNTLWGAMMIQDSLNAGNSLSTALNDWSVRSFALGEYKRIQEGYYGR